ncbi:MAG: DUF4234 domain-containing protein [Candidatus Aquicultorales bacterium]
MTAGDVKAIGKTRSPLLVAFFSLVTLSGYYAYWYYKVTEEMVRHSEAVDANPLMPALAVSPAGALLIIPPFVAARNLTDRLKRIQREEAFAESSVGIGIMLQLLCWVAFPYYVQSELNAHWDLHRKMDEKARNA